MSKEKQIEEMAWDLCDIPMHPSIHSCKECGGKHCHAQYYAERAYNAGYRKQSEGEWREDTEYYDDDYSECNVRKVFVCSRCGRSERKKEPYCNCGAKMKGGE